MLPPRCIIGQQNAEAAVLKDAFQSLISIHRGVSQYGDLQVKRLLNMNWLREQNPRSD